MNHEIIVEFMDKCRDVSFLIVGIIIVSGTVFVTALGIIFGLYCILKWIFQ